MPILARFDEAYSMLSPTGKLITYQQFREGLPSLRGTRPTLIMEISDVVVRHLSDGAALVTYQGSGRPRIPGLTIASRRRCFSIAPTGRRRYGGICRKPGLAEWSRKSEWSDNR